MVKEIKDGVLSWGQLFTSNIPQMQNVKVDAFTDNTVILATCKIIE